MIKRLARWILRDQIQYDNELIKRLKGYCVELGVSGRIEPSGTDEDRTYDFQRAFDVVGGVQLAAGTFHTNSVITLDDENKIIGETPTEERP